MGKNNDQEMYDKYGVKYYQPGVSAVQEANDNDLYYFKTYIGPLEKAVQVEKGDCVFFIGPDKDQAFVQRGPTTLLESKHVATVVRGYMPEDKSTTILYNTNLPYVNGCSTKQVFPPERHGDPTLQMLIIPPHSSEQAHHIHSTVRVVYVLEGEGTSVVGMDKNVVRTKLKPGMVCILEKMCPHHFETKDKPLKVIPLHVWSSVGGLENNHPMFNGTYMMNQGND